MFAQDALSGVPLLVIVEFKSLEDRVYAESASSGGLECSG